MYIMKHKEDHVHLNVDHQGPVFTKGLSQGRISRKVLARSQTQT